MERIIKNAVTEARQLIQSRIAELQEELGHLERALHQLDDVDADGSAKPARGSGKRQRRRKGKESAKGKAPSGKRRKRSAPGQRQQQLLDAIKDNPGAGGSKLAKAIGIQPGQVYGLLRKAQADKSIVKEGKGYRLKGQSKA